MLRLPGASFADAVAMAPGTEVAPGGEDDCAEANVPPACAVWVCALAPLAWAEGVPLAELAVGLPRSVVSVWLIEINCSRLFTFTNWLMYSLGSVSAVGSWFFISVTSRVRKSFAETVAESLLALLELFELFAPLAAAAMGLAVLPARACAAVV
jgi:hypothetical protein